MAADHKKNEKEIIAQDVVIKTTGNVEIIEKASSQTSTTDPLSDFKEKMVEEESLSSGNAPKKNYMWPILFIFILAIALMVGIFVYKQGIFKGVKVNVVTLSPTPTITPEPTKAIDLAQYEIEIQNGSGVEGEASRQKLSLTAEGFTISSVGNADNSDYTDTIIQAKKEVNKDFIVKLEGILGDSFTVGETEVLSDDSSTPVIIILGTKL
ncbi:MAG: LytR protein [Candidatus Levybacteria bacterium]|nr:LytR protein [Candidatus Levybacteria bacterium]